MRLLEYQGKEVIGRYGIPVPKGLLVRELYEAETAAREICYPVVLKAQIPVGGRAKAGAVSVVKDSSALAAAFASVTNSSLGEKHPLILVEEFFQHEEELYISITLDRGERHFVLIASRQGGIDVERIGEKLIVPLSLEPLEDKKARDVATGLGLGQPVAGKLADILVALSRVSIDAETELCEINPLALSSARRFAALDAKIVVDDNSLFRHPDLSGFAPQDSFEAVAASQGFSFVPLEGEVIVVGNGAGLVLATLDLVSDLGGRPACFLDLGGGASAERVYAAMKLANELPFGNVVFLNIFGGITRGTEVARALLDLFGQGLMKKPVFVRIAGAEEEEAKRMLERTPLRMYRTPEEAARAAVEEARS